MVLRYGQMSGHELLCKVLHKLFLTDRMSQVSRGTCPTKLLLSESRSIRWFCVRDFNDSLSFSHEGLHPPSQLIVSVLFSFLPLHILPSLLFLPLIPPLSFPYLPPSPPFPPSLSTPTLPDPQVTSNRVAQQHQQHQSGAGPGN